MAESFIFQYLFILQNYKFTICFLLELNELKYTQEIHIHFVQQKDFSISELIIDLPRNLQPIKLKIRHFV